MSTGNEEVRSGHTERNRLETLWVTPEGGCRVGGITTILLTTVHVIRPPELKPLFRVRVSEPLMILDHRWMVRVRVTFFIIDLVYLSTLVVSRVPQPIFT